MRPFAHVRKILKKKENQKSNQTVKSIESKLKTNGKNRNEVLVPASRLQEEPTSTARIEDAA